MNLDYIQDVFRMVRHDREDWLFMLVNFVRDSGNRGEIFDVRRLLRMLGRGCKYMLEKQERLEEYRNWHYPKQGTTHGLCSFCGKKGEIVCDGCTKYSEKECYLCFGLCWKEYHRGL